jgi:hypothetical protein
VTVVKCRYDGISHGSVSLRSLGGVLSFDPENHFVEATSIQYSVLRDQCSIRLGAVVYFGPMTN